MCPVALRLPLAHLGRHAALVLLGACISDGMRNASPQSLPCQQSYIPAHEAFVQPGTRLAIGCRAFAMPTTPAHQARLAILWETRIAFRQQSKPNRISKMAPRCRAILPDSPRFSPILRDCPRFSPILPDSARFSPIPEQIEHRKRGNRTVAPSRPSRSLWAETAQVPAVEPNKKQRQWL